MSEYYAVVQLLFENEEGFARNSYQYAVEKETVEKSLAQYKYDLPIEKLCIWRTLKWIDTTPTTFTRCVRQTNSDSQKRMIVFDLNVYSFLRKCI